MRITTFTGGIFDTNAYLLESEGACIFIDAPQGSAAWLTGKKAKIDLLLLTHGHIDHVADAAEIQRSHRCQLGYHRDGIRMLTEPGFFRKMGFQFDIEPASADFLIEETASWTFKDIDFEVLHVPGHCPGSLCFLEKKGRQLFGGDVLFAGSIGRTDLPGGDHGLLLDGIKHKVLPLGDDVTVLSGHGPPTTIGQERKTNPFLQT